MDMMLELHQPTRPDGRAMPYGIAVSPEIFAALVEKYLLATDTGVALILTGTPVIELKALAINEMRVAMTPMAWLQLLVEKRREEGGKGGVG